MSRKWEEYSTRDLFPLTYAVDKKLNTHSFDDMDVSEEHSEEEQRPQKKARQDKTPAPSQEPSLPPAPVKRPRAKKDLASIDEALKLIIKDFEHYKTNRARQGLPVSQDEDISDKYARAINAVNAYNWYKSSPAKLPTRVYDWGKK